MPEIRVIVTGLETICIYNDALAPLISAADSTEIKRASHVEPTTDGRWTADLSPSGGPVLGPFQLRQQAIDAELEWLAAHL